MVQNSEPHHDMADISRLSRAYEYEDEAYNAEGKDNIGSFDWAENGDESDGEITTLEDSEEELSIFDSDEYEASYPAEFEQDYTNNVTSLQDIIAREAALEDYYGAPPKGSKDSSSEPKRSIFYELEELELEDNTKPDLDNGEEP